MVPAKWVGLVYWRGLSLPRALLFSGLYWGWPQAAGKECSSVDLERAEGRTCVTVSLWGWSIYSAYINPKPSHI